jgi:DNA-binding MarR family transcriptional regulator
VTIDPDDHVTWLLRQAAEHGRRRVNDAIAGHGITSAQLGVLNRLADAPGLSGAELARRSLITSQAAQLALSSLERRGLVVRKPDPAHRGILQAFLTEQGRSLVDDALADAYASEQELLSVLDAAEQAQLSDYLRRVLRAPG